MKLPRSDLKGWVMKLFKDWNNPGRAPTGKPTGNSARWAREAVANGRCQDAVDTKAFTGRGVLYELRQFVAALDELERRMTVLSETSRAVEGARICLALHRRHSSGYMALRWRERVGAKAHLPWSELDARLAEQPPAQRRWCGEANALALQLNAEHLVLRERIKALRMRLWQSTSPVYARPIPAGG